MMFKLSKASVRAALLCVDGIDPDLLIDESRFTGLDFKWSCRICARALCVVYALRSQDRAVVLVTHRLDPPGFNGVASSRAGSPRG